MTGFSYGYEQERRTRKIIEEMLKRQGIRGSALEDMVNSYMSTLRAMGEGKHIGRHAMIYGDYSASQYASKELKKRLL